MPISVTFYVQNVPVVRVNSSSISCYANPVTKFNKYIESLGRKLTLIYYGTTGIKFIVIVKLKYRKY